MQSTGHGYSFSLLNYYIFLNDNHTSVIIVLLFVNEYEVVAASLGRGVRTRWSLRTLTGSWGWRGENIKVELISADVSAALLLPNILKINYDGVYPYITVKLQNMNNHKSLHIFLYIWFKLFLGGQMGKIEWPFYLNNRLVSSLTLYSLLPSTAG